MKNIQEDYSTIKSFDFGQKIKAKADSFSNNINRAFEKQGYTPNLSNIEKKDIINKEVSEVVINKDPQNPKPHLEHIKVKATNFTNNINKAFDSIESEKKSPLEDEITNLDDLSYEELLLLEAKKSSDLYIKELSVFDLMIVKQSLAKIIINPEVKKISLNGQSLVKTFSDNFLDIDNHICKFIKDDQEKLMFLLSQQNKLFKDNKLLPQKIKDFTILLFKMLQVNYFLRFKI
ncbi:MAG: hypothetical protein ACK4IX_04685 [Candidatus Sericytochromatia bacterium]